MEFFYLNILPWRGDQIAASVLHKKQRFFDGDFPRVFKRAPVEFTSIMHHISKLQYSDIPDYAFIFAELDRIRMTNNIDFLLPYDWELLDRSAMQRMTDRTQSPAIQDCGKRESTEGTQGGSSTDVEMANQSINKNFKVEKFKTRKTKGVDDFIDVNLTAKST
uniref:Ycf1 n=1 Tax=Panagrolaimus sp. JU765 TaxID=591449 RepID=A0AC34QBT4_9BILA